MLGLSFARIRVPEIMTVLTGHDKCRHDDKTIFWLGRVSPRGNHSGTGCKLLSDDSGRLPCTLRKYSAMYVNFLIVVTTCTSTRVSLPITCNSRQFGVLILPQEVTDSPEQVGEVWHIKNNNIPFCGCN